ncbi:NACHT-domain-containing protein [Penicillium malachiteum]|nr:NACHT-domain-containing protein [Penicillium malachiteum]
MSEKLLPSAVEADAPPESTKSSTKSTTKSTTESTENTISLWDNAYDKLKEKNGELVSNYEELLSRALVHGKKRFITPSFLFCCVSILTATYTEISIDKSQPPSPELESEGGPCKNEIPQDNIAERREKLREIIEIGLKHMKDNKLSTTVLGHKIILDDALASTAKAVDWAAEYVNDAVQDVPYGPAVMAGISLLLPLLRNPAMVEEANREGLVYVTSQMKFYNAMETQLLMIHPATRSDLLERLEELYCLVIEFQMESVIRFYTKRTKNYLNAIVDCDHWEEKRSHIEMEEHSMQRKLETTLSIEKSRYLKELLQEAKESRQDLTKIVLSILDVTQRMERRLSTSEHRECVKELGASDPCDDKTRIEEQKGGLIWDEPTFKWILDNPDYQRWLESDQDHLFWIKGDPGKGKTMLMCGIINELIKSVREKGNVVYFFCQESDRRINSAASVARGLIYMLVKQQRAMFPHLQQPFRDSKRFDDANAWTALCKILKSILDDPNLDTTYIVIDGLDECVDNLNGLLDLIACSSCRNPKVKWIVSSRNWVHIKKKRNQAISPSVLSLDMNTQEVRNAVERFIKLRVQDLPFKESTRSIISHNLSERAEDTFLWAALVCLELENVKDLEAQEISSKFPNDLNSLYNLMVKRIDQLRPHRKGTCYQILSIVSLAYHPLTLSQLAILSDFESVIPDEGDIKDILEECGSFLAQHEERPVYFVHQTAKEFMLKERHDEMFETGEENRHHALFSQSMKAISTKLRRDVCDLKDPGYFIGEAELPKSSELAAVQYSCLYWVDHLIAGGPHEEDLEEGGLIEKFLRKDYLHWLEALSLLRSVSIGVLMMLKLESFLAVSQKPSRSIFFMLIPF